MKRTLHAPSALVGAATSAALVLTLGAQSTATAVAPAGPVPLGVQLTPEQAEILGHMSLVYLDDGSGNAVNKTIRVSGVNLQVVSGSGATDGAPSGVGNLIVGYNEGSGDRTGSHNIVGGSGSDYGSYGGLVVGSDNAALGAYASVLGGIENTAASDGSVVCGGSLNHAAGLYSVVAGGQMNQATGTLSTIGGGQANESGGGLSTVSGGYHNASPGHYSSVGGGRERSASGSYDWAAGSLLEEE